MRQGYIPQDEQTKFTSHGARARQGAQRVPGMDNAELDAQQTATSAKSSQRRRPKKPTSSTAATDAPPVAQMAGLRLDRNKQSEASRPEADLSVHSGVSAPEASTSHDAVALDKLIKALRKKVAACDALAKRQQAGDKLTAPELDKLSKSTGWQAEISELEERLQSVA